jgi:hypothetical protein
MDRIWTANLFGKENAPAENAEAFLRKLITLTGVVGPVMSAAAGRSLVFAAEARCNRLACHPWAV